MEFQRFDGGVIGIGLLVGIAVLLDESTERIDSFGIGRDGYVVGAARQRARHRTTIDPLGRRRGDRRGRRGLRHSRR